VILPILALGQTQTTGEIAGTVRDGQGAVIVNVVIQLENTATGEKRATASDTSGNFKEFEEDHADRIALVDQPITARVGDLLYQAFGAQLAEVIAERRPGVLRSGNSQGL